MKRIVGPAGIMVHGIHEDNHRPLSQGSISLKKLEKIIKKLKSRIIDADKWIEKSLNNKLEKDLCLTLDDNLRSQIKYAVPLLKKFKIKAFFLYIHFYI